MERIPHHRVFQNIDECYRPLLGSNPQTFQYVGTCPDSNDCPNYRRCTSIWGLCVTPEEVSFSNANVVPSFFDDCPPGTECVRPISRTDCSSNALGRPPYDVSTCTCADNGGVFTTQEECFNQCGAVAYAADASTGGTYTPQGARARDDGSLKYSSRKTSTLHPHGERLIYFICISRTHHESKRLSLLH